MLSEGYNRFTKLPCKFRIKHLLNEFNKAAIPCSFATRVRNSTSSGKA